MARGRPALELCWGTARGVGLVELIDIAGVTGYRSLAVRPSMYFEARAEGFTDGELRSRLDDAGVVVGVVDPLTAGLPGIPPAAEVDPRLRSFLAYGEDDCYTTAEGLGATTVNLAHFLGRPQPLDRLAEAIGAVAGRAVERGLRLSLEFIPLTGIPDLAAALELRRVVGQPNLGVMFDTWHFTRSGGTVGDVLDLPPGAVTGLQVSDATADALTGPYVPMVDRLVPGTGTLPLVPLLSALLEGSPDLHVGVEVFRGDLRRMGAAAAADLVAQAMRPILDQLADPA
ncbi:MAG TPA: sugar phosphate isomerase/epimerase [Acidimicrobiales bacterium]|jgi:sugar phosphate isomerase/epimerase|nr:sugar phosphate isomerase/epimerase [Acidimicrobiales bacterium]